MPQTYKFKLYSNANRSRVLSDTIDLFGRLWNYCVWLDKRHRELFGVHFPFYKMQKFLAHSKNRPWDSWIKQLPSQAVQNVVERLHRAINLHYVRLRKHQKTSLPKYKRVEKYKSFTLKQAGYKFLEDNKVRLLGHVYKYVKTRAIEGNIKTLTIKRDKLGNLWLFVVTDHERSEKQSASGQIVGYDIGLKRFMVGSNGSIIEFPLFLKAQLNKVKRLNRNLSEKKLFSNRWKKAKRQIAKLHQHIANQRDDMQWKLARRLLFAYDLICLETLDLKAMANKSGVKTETGYHIRLGRKLHDFAFYAFIQKLKYLAEVFGKQVIQIADNVLSSKTCSDCGYVKDDLLLKDREWVCPKCGKYHDRDLNAAINILREGTSSLGLGNVRPMQIGCCCLNPESPTL